MMAPVLYGLVLAGGKSLRMGVDKGRLSYHGKPQREHLYDLLLPLCERVFISCNAAQQRDILLPKIGDEFPEAGPMGGLLSAFNTAPGKAWLAVACDMPYLSQGTLQYLVEHRNPAKMATAFIGPEDGWPEPMVAVWEPEMHPVLLREMQTGKGSLRDVLKDAATALVQPPRLHELQNINAPDAYEIAAARIKLQARRNPH